MIRAELARRGVTQKGLAAHLGVSQPVISDRLRGETAWDIDQLDQASRFLGMTVRDLLDEVPA